MLPWRFGVVRCSGAGEALAKIGDVGTGLTIILRIARFLPIQR
jgi:hypothetical protein